MTDPMTPEEKMVARVKELSGRVEALEKERDEVARQAACGHHSYRWNALPCSDCGWVKPSAAMAEGREGEGPKETQP